MEKNTAPVDRDVNTSDGAQHGTGRGSDRALLPSRKVSRSQWPTRACRVCGPGSASRGSGVTRRAVGWDSLACAPWPRAARAVNTVKAANTGLDSVRVPGDWPAVPQPPGSRPGLQAPGVGAVRGRSAPDAVGARPWGRAGHERGGHGRTRAVSSLRTVRGQRPGSPRGRLLWGRLLSPRACLSSAPPTPPEQGKATLLGTDPWLRSWLKSQVHFPCITSYTQNRNSKRPGPTPAFITAAAAGPGS